jgi:hypothetical protein
MSDPHGRTAGEGTRAEFGFAIENQPKGGMHSAVSRRSHRSTSDCVLKPKVRKGVLNVCNQRRQGEI